MRYFWYHDLISKRRTNVIGALTQDKIVTIALFDCTINTDVFEALLQQSLLSVLQNGYVVAWFYKSEKIQEAVEAAGCLVEYLPPYSPDFNPIEHTGHKQRHSEENSAVRQMRFFSNLACSQSIVLTDRCGRKEAHFFPPALCDSFPIRCVFG